jgi:hypothetical protein
MSFVGFENFHQRGTVASRTRWRFRQTLRGGGFVVQRFGWGDYKQHGRDCVGTAKNSIAGGFAQLLLVIPALLKT